MRASLILVFLFVSGITFTQEDSVSIESVTTDYSVNGKKHIISLNGLGSIPFLYHLGVGDPYFFKAKKGTLVNKKPFFEFGARLEYVYINSKKMGFGIEFGVDKYKIAPDYLNWAEIGEVHHEMLDVLTYSLIPKIEVRKKKKANLPYDFSSQFGIGVNLSQVIERNYQYEIINEHTSGSFEAKELYNFDHAPFLGITILYALNYRLSLTDNLLLNLGTRFTLNGNFQAWPFKDSSNEVSDLSDNNYWISREKMRHRINGNRLNSIINLNIGLTYLLK